MMTWRTRVSGSVCSYQFSSTQFYSVFWCRGNSVTSRSFNNGFVAPRVSSDLFQVFGRLRQEDAGRHEASLGKHSNTCLKQKEVIVEAKVIELSGRP